MRAIRSTVFVFAAMLLLVPGRALAEVVTVEWFDPAADSGVTSPPAPGPSASITASTSSPAAGSDVVITWSVANVGSYSIVPEDRTARTTGTPIRGDGGGTPITRSGEFRWSRGSPGTVDFNLTTQGPYIYKAAVVTWVAGSTAVSPDTGALAGGGGGVDSAVVVDTSAVARVSVAASEVRVPIGTQVRILWSADGVTTYTVQSTSPTGAVRQHASTTSATGSVLSARNGNFGYSRTSPGTVRFQIEGQ